MKVILLKDVARIGKRFEVKDVPSGHALNFLIPRKMAEPATPENLKRVKARKDTAVAGEAHASEAFALIAEKLNGGTLDIPVEANEKGSLFKGIKAGDIAAHIEKTQGSLGNGTVTLPAPIKETGAHEITLTSGKTRVTFTLNVIKK